MLLPNAHPCPRNWFTFLNGVWRTRLSCLIPWHLWPKALHPRTVHTQSKAIQLVLAPLTNTSSISRQITLSWSDIQSATTFRPILPARPTSDHSFVNYSVSPFFIRSNQSYLLKKLKKDLFSLDYRTSELF